MECISENKVIPDGGSWKGQFTYGLGTHQITDFRYCGGHHRMAADQQYRTLDPAGRILKAGRIR